MRKLFLLIACLLCWSVLSVQAQTTPAQAREAEWKNYVLPQTNFVRQTNVEREFIFRVPADWKQEPGSLAFTGPHTATIKVYAQKIPDGYSLQEYFGSVLRVIKDSPDAAETTVTRKTQLQDLEAREIFFESPNAEGDVIRSTSWIVVHGPLALTFNLQVPVAHSVEVEPFFKAVVQSVMLLPTEHQAFEQLRATTLKPAAPGPIHELESIVASLSEAGLDRDAAVRRLSSLFSSASEIAVDLLLDRRPLVRAAAVQALAKSNNSTLEPFLWEIIDDKEPLVAEAAARSVAGVPDVIAKVLRVSSSGMRIEPMARLWPFMPKDKRTELLQRVFSETAVPRATPSPAPKNDVTVTVSALTPVKPGAPVPDVTVGVSNDPQVQLGALTLLGTMPREEFKLPFERILASNHDPLIAVGLQVATYRSETLPSEPLFKLVTSSNQRIRWLAAQNLGLAATVADIPRIEALLSKDSAADKRSVDDELKLSIKRIRFRNELNSAKSVDEQREVIRKTLADPPLAFYAWLYHCEHTEAGCTNANAPIKPDFAINSFGENLFPAKMRHYTAIPNPAQAVQKFYETLNGLQMDSPRAQSNVALILNSVRQLLRKQLSAPTDAETLIEYTGIDPNSPIAFGVWTSDKAADTTVSAQRTAIVLRVKDRARFERVVEQFQRSTGSFANLSDYVAASTRAIAALPAILPISAQAMAQRDAAKPGGGPPPSYSFVGEKDWNGLKVKTIEHRWINSSSEVDFATTHVAYLGDTAILTTDLATIRDLLTNANQTESPRLAENPEFRKAVDRKGDVVYFSDLKAVLAELTEIKKDFDYKINESGTLNIGNASWENIHHLEFEESDWAKPFFSFDPKQLRAPRELLPSSTIAYYFMNIDLSQVWSDKLRTFFVPDDLLKDTSKLWAVDFKQEVLPELGPECGAAILELPAGKAFSEPTWAGFCRLKSNKLSDALSAGKLFNGVGPAKDAAEIKVGTNSYYVAARNGFLIISNHQKALVAFDGKSNLVATRDYSRAVAKVPNGIVAFGGYNLEAAVAAASKTTGEGLEGQIAAAIFSIAGAFHSQNFFATATRGTVEARSSVSMDREGRYSVADFSQLTKGSNLTMATLEPGGVPISDQNRLSSLLLRLRSKASGPIDNIKDDIKTSDQIVEQKSPQELIVKIAARRSNPEKSAELPVKEPDFAMYLKATAEFPANDERIKEQAREIAGTDRDAWSVARKLADWTHENLEWKHVVSADATQTLATREADCSEFSALFVAMARSLGLPARLVSGLAYSGSSFGGHAWVEVWAGKWIELDPTWGTHYVDATHIRNSSSALVTSAALNLVELEVLETGRTVADFQKSPNALAEHLAKAIPTGNRRDVEAALDLATLTDEYMGVDTWSRMNEVARNQMSSAYRRVLNEIMSYRSNSPDGKMRVLHLEEKGNVADATCLLGLGSVEMLLKLRFVRRGDLWSLVEVLHADTTLHTISEAIRPTITAIENTRAGRKASAGRTDFTRVMLLFESEPAKAVTVAESLLAHKPADQSLRLLKALGLVKVEKNDEAIKLLRELSAENFAPAIYKLGDLLSVSEEEKDEKEAITLYERYALLEPHDARVVADLAYAYDTAEDFVKAEAAYRKVVEVNPADGYGYLNLISFLILRNRANEVRPVLVAAEKNKDDNWDIFGEAMDDLVSFDDPTYGDKLAASEPERMKTSYLANLSLGRIYAQAKRYPAALRQLQTAAQLEKEANAPHVVMAFVYRKQSRWATALKAADQAIAIDDEDAEAYYERACVLARLGRSKEAISALEKAIELDPDQALWIEEETDLKPLARLAAFKKLIPAPEKP